MQLVWEKQEMFIKISLISLKEWDQLAYVEVDDRILTQEVLGRISSVLFLIRYGWHSKRHVQLSEAVFSLRSAPKLYKQDNFLLSGIRRDTQKCNLITLLSFFSKWRRKLNYISHKYGAWGGGWVVNSNHLAEPTTRNFESRNEKSLNKLAVKVRNWFHLAQNSDHWRAFVSAVMSFLFP
jgi:hypothetical protein